jgi:hypothetical protein
VRPGFWWEIEVAGRGDRRGAGRGRAAVDVAQNDHAYRVDILVLGQLRTEEVVHGVELRVEDTCVEDAEPEGYTIGASSTGAAADENRQHAHR